MAGDEESGVLIGNRKRIAVETVARAKVALEVGRPSLRSTDHKMWWRNSLLASDVEYKKYTYLSFI